MKLSKSFTKVTTVSKILALVLFIAMPFIGFYLGFKYGTADTQVNNYQEASPLKAVSSYKIYSAFDPQNRMAYDSEKTHTPKEVTETFYNWYFSCLNNHFSNTDNIDKQNTSGQNCPYQVSPLVSLDLIDNLYDKWGFDPIICAQDTPTSVKTGNERINGNTATVSQQVIFGPDSTSNITVSLKLVSKQYFPTDKLIPQWKITNIQCPR